MSAEKTGKRFDLADRTLEFARDVRGFLKKLPRTLANREDGKQLVRSSGSVGANYIEANESLSHKDFVYRIKICRKEAKESCYWLKLVDTHDEIALCERRDALLQEATELMRIFGAIVSKAERKL